jgi:hypothetical protein
MNEKREITIGRLPVMVKSGLCWMSDVEKSDCEFDHGGYFLIKGAEKVSYNYDFFIYLHEFLSCLLHILYILWLHIFLVLYNSQPFPA